MPKKTMFKHFQENDEDDDPVVYLKSLNLEDLIIHKNINTILVNQHYFNFDKKLKPLLIDLYDKYNYIYNDNNFFNKDYDRTLSHAFSSMIYEHININYDLELLYNNPELAIEVFE